MQSYVHSKSGSLKDRKGNKFFAPCIDDSKISSATLEEHIEHVGLLCEASKAEGYELKWKASTESVID